jgi:DNA-binding NtrC family response regulator
MASVLIVDEERDFCSLLRRVLTQQGHQVATFTRFKEALKWLAGHPTDLLIVSGGKHGENARGVRDALASAGFSGARVLLTIPESALDEVRARLTDGFLGLLTKPVNISDLESRVGSTLGVLESKGP